MGQQCRCKPTGNAFAPHDNEDCPYYEWKDRAKVAEQALAEANAEVGRLREWREQALMEMELSHVKHGPKRRETCRGCRWLSSDFAREFGTVTPEAVAEAKKREARLTRLAEVYEDGLQEIRDRCNLTVKFDPIDRLVDATFIKSADIREKLKWPLTHEPEALAAARKEG